MKQIYFFMICLFFSTTIIGQTEINFDPASTDGTGWIGFMNVSESAADGGGFIFGSGWGTGDLIVEDNTDGTVNLKPNRIGDPDVYWQGTAPAGNPTGGKTMDATYYLEDDALAGTAFNFNARVITNTLNSTGLDSPITYTAFIKVFAADYSSNRVVASYNLSAGNFTLSALASDSVAGEHVQYGFTVNGPNIRLDTVDDNYTPAYDALGSIVVGPNTLSVDEVVTSEFNVFPNPTTNNWNVKSNQQINSIQVYDVLGKQVLSLNPNTQNVTINAESLNSGLYFARLNSDVGTKTVKLVKE